MGKEGFEQQIWSTTKDAITNGLSLEFHEYIYLVLRILKLIQFNPYITNWLSPEFHEYIYLVLKILKLIQFNPYITNWLSLEFHEYIYLVLKILKLIQCNPYPHFAFSKKKKFYEIW